jgi:ABC-type uncharacterized transport system substrate-binding protein
LAARPYGAVRDLVLAANTLRHGHPILRAFRLSADYGAYEDPDPEFARYDWKPLDLVGSSRAVTLGDWQDAVRLANRTADVVIVSIDDGMRRSTTDPTVVSVHDIIAWTEANSAIPVLGLSPAYVEEGGMAAVGVSPYEQGLVAGKIAVELADRHVQASTIKIAETAQFVVALRESVMRQRGFQLPAIYHAIANATEQDFE